MQHCQKEQKKSGELAFSSTELTSISIPSSVTLIENQALNIKTLTSLEFKDINNWHDIYSDYGYKDNGVGLKKTYRTYIKTVNNPIQRQEGQHEKENTLYSAQAAFQYQGESLFLSLPLT